MTIATTATTDFNVDELVTLAYKLSGFGPHDPSSGDIELGRKVLFLGLQSLANDGIVIRAWENVALTLTAGIAFVDMPTDTLSIESGGYVRNLSGSDIVIDPMTLEEYNCMPTKTTTGMPSRYVPFQNSNGTWRILFWPVPTSDFPTFIVPRTRRARDVSVGNVTLDFDPRWHLAIVKFLQANIARSKGRRDLANELTAEYREERERATNNETDHGDGMFIVDDSIWG